MSIGIADATNNKDLGVENTGPGLLGAARVVLYDSAGNPLIVSNGAVHPDRSVPVAGNNDGIARALGVDQTGAVRTAVWTRVFHDAVDGAALNTSLWTSAATVYAVAQANRIITLNSASSGAASASANITSVARFSRHGGVPLRRRVHFRPVWLSQSQWEIGLGVPSGAAAITDGVYLRAQLTGTVQLVVVFNGTEIALDIGTFAAVFGADPSRWYLLDLVVFDDRVECTVRRRDGASGSLPTAESAPIIETTLQLPVSQVAEFNAIALPAFSRMFTSALFSTGVPNLLLGPDTVSIGDVNLSLDQPTQAALLAQTGHATPAGAIASTANYANSAAPASATLSNTSAGYATKGGQWQFAAIAGAETDYVLFAYPVPTGKRLIVRGMTVDAWVMGAASATTPTLLQWGIGRGTAASLANNQHRTPVGAQTIPVGTPIGGMADRRVSEKVAPFVVESGQFLQVILKMPVSTATASQIIRGVCAVETSFI
jgi:hypothetical protein